MISQQILRNTDIDSQLLSEGYAVIPFLNATEVEELTRFYYSHHKADHNGMYATAHVPDISFRSMMNEQIQKKVSRAAAENFINYRILGGSFIAKGKGRSGTLHPHQDWNIVDEEEYRSFNIWIPLVDLQPDNGTILVMPQSHRWLRTFRSANINSAFSKINEVLWKSMKPLYMKQGEALVYDHRLLHASGENKTDTTRLTAVAGMIPDGANMYYYHKSGDHEVEVFESNPDFFLKQNIFEGPVGLKSVKRFDHEFPEVDFPMYEKFRKAGTTSSASKSLFERLRSLFTEA